MAERLAQAERELPDGASPALTPDAAATGQIFWYTVEGANFDLGRLRAIQDWYVRPQLASVPGVADVSSVGGFPIEYQVVPDPHKMRVLGVSLHEVIDAVASANASAGGHVVHKGNAEYVVREVMGRPELSPRPGDEGFDSARVVRDLESVVVPLTSGGTIRLAEVANIAIGPGFRRGVLEKDGSEVTGGMILMARGENPLEITRRIRPRSASCEPACPPACASVPFYDRTPLIQGAIGTVANTVFEAMISASLCVLVVLLHVRTSIVVASTIPLAALSSFFDHDASAQVGRGRHPGERDVARGHCHFDRRAGRFVSRHGRKRDAPSARTIWWGHRSGQRSRNRLAGLSGRRAADRFLCNDHGAFLPAGLCAWRHRGRKCSGHSHIPRRLP